MTLQEILLIAVVALPATAVLLLGVSNWFLDSRSERAFAGVVGLAFSGSTIAALGLATMMLANDTDIVEAQLGLFFDVGAYHFRWALIGDHLSVPFSLLCSLLLGVVAAFSRRYLHREDGFFRFYFLLSLLGLGVHLVSLAACLDALFFGWELVGITSALLIAFFHHRRMPVENALRAFLTYRFCDIGLLSAAVWFHHSMGSSHLVPIDGNPFLGLPVAELGSTRMVLGFLLLWAAIGKGALVPLGGWLPRAMEGPTPSSAIFYGAVSIHLAPYLLLRAGALIEQTPWVAATVVLLGLLTAGHSTFVGRVQSDIKSTLAYASMTQVGLIVMEIGLGWHQLALWHIVGHAAVRSLQILRSPSLLADHYKLEQAMGTLVPRPGGHLERLVPKSLQPWLYRHALERGYFDAAIARWILLPIIRLLQRASRIDQDWIDQIAGIETTAKGSAAKVKEVLS